MRRTALPAAAGTVVLISTLLAGCAGEDAPPDGRYPSGYLTAQEVVAREGLPSDARIRYGAAEPQFGELRLPEGEGPWPVVVVIHGGCWLSIADHDYMDPVAASLTAAGWATWNLEMRALDQEGGAWPGIFRDVAAGVDHLRAVARDHPLDLDRVAALGHSSGGHLALWAASRPRIPEGAELHDPDPLPIRGVVGLAAIADLEHYHGLGISWEDGCGDAPTRLLGGTAPPDAPERVAQASPAALLPTGVPHLLVTGVDDPAVPPEHGEAYVAAAAGAGQEATHHRIAGSAHFEIVTPGTEAWARVWAVTEPFLERVAPRSPGTHTDGTRDPLP